MEEGKVSSADVVGVCGTRLVVRERVEYSTCMWINHAIDTNDPYCFLPSVS